MYAWGGPSIHLRPTTVQIASMKEEKELSPREGGKEGICFLAPKMRWEGRKRKRNGQTDRHRDRSRYPRGLYINNS